MSLEPASSNPPQFASLPLDYGSESLDPLSPVLRTISALLLVLGIASFVLQSFYAITYVGIMFRGPNLWPAGFYYILGIPLSIVQMIAGGLNTKQLGRINCIWAWIWTSVGVHTLQTMIRVLGDLVQFHSRGIGVYVQVFASIIDLPLQCALALFVMILLRYRSRILAFDPPK